MVVVLFAVCPTKAIKILNFETNTDESILAKNENWYVCSIVVRFRPGKTQPSQNEGMHENVHSLDR